MAGIIQNFQIDDFMREWDLGTCQYAAERIKKGIQKAQKNTNEGKIFIKITESFGEVENTFYMNRSRPVLSILRIPIEDLILILENNGKLFKKEIPEIKKIKGM